MAKKDISSGFDTQDAQDFLDEYREDAMPTYRKARKEPATESPPSPTEREELARKPVTPDRTKEEDEYLRTFVENCPIDAFNKKGRQVMVVNEFRHKILKIRGFVQRGFIHSAICPQRALAQHFVDVAPILQSLYQKSKQF